MDLSLHCSARNYQEGCKPAGPWFYVAFVLLEAWTLVLFVMLADEDQALPEPG